MNDHKKILLHVCCATCAAGCVERLNDMGFEEIMLFEYNPNIFSQEEHQKRARDIKRLSEEKNIPLYTGPYDHNGWLEKAGHLHDEPEGGKRCDICFEIRLQETARKSRELGADFFASTLSISPHKNFLKIKTAGDNAGKSFGITFLAEDFKKKDGFKKCMQLSREYNFYRQNYCGCEFSKK